MERWASPWLAAQAAYLRHLGTSRAAEVFERGGVYAVRTGVVSNGENGVVSGGDRRVDVQVARAAIEWLQEGKAPASWLCGEGPGRPETTRVLEGLGCRSDAGVEMRAAIAGLDPGDDVLPAGTRIDAVASERQLDAWLEVAGACGWFDSDLERRAHRRLQLGLPLDDSAPLRLYVAFQGDRATGMASAFYAEERVLLVAVAVLESDRRRGLGRALALTRLGEARARGCEVATLAPSPDGAKLYEALGFETHRQAADRWFHVPVNPS